MACGEKADKGEMEMADCLKEVRKGQGRRLQLHQTVPVANWQQLCVVVSGGCVVLQSLKLSPHMYAYISNPSCSPWTLGVQWWVQCSSCSGATLVGLGEASM